MTDQQELDYLTQSLSNNNSTTDYVETTIDEYGSTTFKPFAKPEYTAEDDMDIEFSKNHQETSLQLLKERIEMTEQESKSSLVYVMQNTDLVNDDHLLGFLCIEKFDVDLALTRLLRYWTNRHKVFGDKYSQPLTLNGAMSDRIDDIRKGFMILLPVLDEKGRAIIYCNPALMGDKVKEVLQVWWYLVHVALEIPHVRQNGFVLLKNSKDCRLRHFDSKRTLGIVRSGTYYFPVQGEGHLCNPMAVFPFVAPLIKAMLSIRLRQTLTVHRGPTDKVLNSLAACSMPSTCLPTTMGGTLDIDSSLEEFIAKRLVVEGECHNRMSDITSASPNMRLVSDSSPSPPAAKVKAAGERKTKHKKCPGRSGDERMNKAVAARKHDPQISLMQALLLGGFSFPEMYTPGVKMAKVKDTDGVTIEQRKNQLNRRLRLDKKNHTK